MDQQIKGWMLAQVNEASARRNWQQLPQDFEMQAVSRLFGSIKGHFGKQDIKARIAASKASTFADMIEAINAA
jgi:hypothetical protein